MIIGLGHQAQVGKDTVAGYLVEKYGFKRLAFADQLKLMALDLNPIVEYGTFHPTLHGLVDRLGWEEAKKEPSVRRFLQNLGVTVRDRIDPDAWANVVRRQILAGEQAGQINFVITDVRFPNEFEMLEDLGALLVKVTRNDRPPVSQHVSEYALTDWPWHKTLENSGTLDELFQKLDRFEGAETVWDSGYSE